MGTIAPLREGGSERERYSDSKCNRERECEYEEWLELFRDIQTNKVIHR